MQEESVAFHYFIIKEVRAAIRQVLLALTTCNSCFCLRTNISDNTLYILTCEFCGVIWKRFITSSQLSGSATYFCTLKKNPSSLRPITHIFVLHSIFVFRWRSHFISGVNYLVFLRQNTHRR